MVRPKGRYTQAGSPSADLLAQALELNLCGRGNGQHEIADRTIHAFVIKGTRFSRNTVEEDPVPVPDRHGTLSRLSMIRVRLQ